MGFEIAAIKSLKANRQLRSSIKRRFKPSKHDFSVKVAPKLTIEKESLIRANEKRKSKDRVVLFVMTIVMILFGIGFYRWIN